MRRGVIHQRPQGTTRLNRLRREDLEARFPGLLQTILMAAESSTATGAETPVTAGIAAAAAVTASVPPPTTGARALA